MLIFVSEKNRPLLLAKGVYSFYEGILNLDICGIYFEIWPLSDMLCVCMGTGFFAITN